jgi:uncharacterized membrane protein
MDTSTVTRTLALGAITGIRSMAGPTTWALGHEGGLKRVTALLAAGEMLADKTPFVGNRTAALPLAGRAMMGALVGIGSARDARANALTGAVIGAVAAIAFAHLAFQARRHLPFSSALGGLLEDAVVIGIAACCVTRASSGGSDGEGPARG